MDTVQQVSLKSSFKILLLVWAQEIQEEKRLQK